MKLFYHHFILCGAAPTSNSYFSHSPRVTVSTGLTVLVKRTDMNTPVNRNTLSVWMSGLIKGVPK